MDRMTDPNDAAPAVRSERGRARSFLLESATIVLSILLALALDAWWESRREQRQVEQARAAFVEEIRGNLALLQDERFHPYHREMWEAFRVGARIENPTMDDMYRIYEGFNNGVWPTPFRDAVWRSLTNTDVMGRLPYDELFVIADIYREQESIDGWHQRMFDVWSEARSDRNEPAFIKDDIQRTRTYLSDVVSGEERLLEMYPRALEALTD